ncbi:phytanoyl-CoA dioxygenase family protein [Mastigocoleus testarum]|uniref:Phytanoyl-CoA dioxygenase n=1 Tax=Mastigocoleus testarum BC008 TaxID=371196 RepID=A0A0V7ZSN5_9CYAN|nr:hypothetical protein [Mastigocoleus testarum]KST67661.1 hypothetical protein BC008_43670 [Mastigocoleus testarum BC008]
MKTSGLEQLQYIPGKIRRDLLNSEPWKTIAGNMRKKHFLEHANSLPSLPYMGKNILTGLLNEGIFVSSLETLEAERTEYFFNTAKKLSSKLGRMPSNGNHLVKLPISESLKYREIFSWSLQEKLINTMENYIQLPLLYHGYEFKREVANGKLVGARRWHQDTEDYRMVKIIIYLNDVDEDNGPFEYIPKHISKLLVKLLRYKSGFVKDETMAKLLSPEHWQTCTGKAGTVIITDVCNMFHRLKAPIRSDRLSLTYSYTSFKPLKLRQKFKLSQADWIELTSELTERQVKCLSSMMPQN